MIKTATKEIISCILNRIMEKQKKKRIIYSKGERNYLIHLIMYYKDIIESKKVDGETLQKKRKAWAMVEMKYNSVVGHKKRTGKQLRKLWDNIKCEKKKEIATIKRELMATGGGPAPTIPVEDPLDYIISTFSSEVSETTDIDSIVLPQAGPSNIIYLPEDTEIEEMDIGPSFIEENRESETTNVSNIKLIPPEKAPSSGITPRENVERVNRVKRQLEYDTLAVEELQIRIKAKNEEMSLFAEVMALKKKKLELEIQALKNQRNFCLRSSKFAMQFSEVVKILNDFAPLSLAESWDNVGVLVEPPDIGPISKLMLTNDLTLAVMEEAENKGVDMILSYHPPIFKAMKSITTAHWKEMIVGRCLAKRIAVYSPHTCYDAVKGGVNDWLISAFGRGDVTPIIPSYASGQWTHKIEISRQEGGSGGQLRSILLENFKDNILILASRDEGGETETVLCSEKHVTGFLSAIIGLPFKTQFAISKLEKVPILDHGAGRHVKLHQPLKLREAVEAVKTLVGLPFVRLAIKHNGNLDDVIYTVAVCAGSGISVVRGVKADLILTGEMSHHEALEMTQRGSNVILIEHSNSERGYLSAILKDKLHDLFDARVEIILSEQDRDPLTVV